MSIAQEIDITFNAQQAYKYTLRKSDASNRIKTLKRLKQAIEKYESEVYSALQNDLRKSNFETAVTELIFVYGEIDYPIKNIKGWMRPKRVGITMSNPLAKNRIYYEP